jgi:thioredoxin reductase
LDIDTSIVGAGPYGLSIAAHLKARRSSHRIFGSPMESWRRFMPQGMVLKSERFASNLWDPERRLTLERYCHARGLSFQAVGNPLPLALFLEYAEWFRQNAALEPLDVRLTHIARSEQGFSLQLADGRTLTSRRVVLATGHMAFRVMPPEIAGLPEPLVVHSSRIAEPQAYSARDVTIVGAGQSALEIAALLHEAGAKVRLLARRRRIEWNRQSVPRPLLQRLRAPDAGVASGWGSWAVSELPRTFRWLFAPQKRHGFVADAYGPSGAWWLRERIEGRVEVCPDSQVQSASISGGRVHMRLTRPGGTEEVVTDHLIAATGFRVDVRRLDYLAPGLLASLHTEADGIPALSASFETSVPGLFIVGVASSPVFGPIMRFMYGAKHAAPILARELR